MNSKKLGITELLEVVQISDDIKSDCSMTWSLTFVAKTKKDKQLIVEGNLPEKIGLLKSFFRVKRKETFSDFILVEDSFRWNHDEGTISFQIIQKA